MANDQRIAGVAYVKADGVQYALGGTLTVSTDLVEREGIAGLSGPAGYKESWRIPYIEGEFLLKDDLSIADLTAITEATVQAELANGHVYVLRRAWCKGAHELNAADGTVTVRFEGLGGEELA
jgi:hypothetical protein